MKNKKKSSSQIHSRNQAKQDKHDPPVILKKSPLKHKSQQSKSQTQVYSESGNFNLHPFKQMTLFYGKKYHYGDINPKKVGDSNQSSTHCSFNNRSGKQKSIQNRKTTKSKSFKATKNQELYQQQIEQQEQMDIKLNSRQVMELINSYATKIQRQWRRYWFRKCLRFIVLKERERKQYELLNGFYGSGLRSVENCRMSQGFQDRRRQNQQRLEKDNNKRHTLPKLNTHSLNRKIHLDQVEKSEQSNKNESFIKRQHHQSSNDNQLTQQFYNNQKYASLSSFNSGKLISNIDLMVKNKESQHQRTSSLGQKVENAQKNNLKAVKMVQVGLNTSLKSLKEIPEHEGHFSTPVNGLKGTNQINEIKSSEKKSNIKLQTKVYECKVADESKSNLHSANLSRPSQKSFSKNLTDEFKKVQKPSQNMKSSQSIDSKYDTKFPSQQSLQKGPKEVTKIFKKYKKAIQKQGIKKISKIEKHFEEKQITQRTYKNLLHETKQKLSKEIKTLQLKEGHFKNSWKEVYVMFKDYVKENSFQQGDTGRSERCQNKMPVEWQEKDDHSISFDKWDFQSSAKKSISHLESFEEFARQLNERNPQKFKAFFVDNKKQLSDSKPIEFVLDELDRLENELEKREEVSEFKDEEGGSIFEEFRQRQRTNSFQKKSEKVLVEDIKQKISYAEIKSPHVSPRHSPKQPSIEPFPTKKPVQTIQQDQQPPILSNRKFLSPKHEQFQFLQITTPQKSIQIFGNNSPIDQIPSSKTKEITQRIKTDESEEGSEVEIKITSIDVEQKDERDKKQANDKKEKKNFQLFVPEDAKQKLQTSLLKQLEVQKEVDKAEEKKRINKDKISDSKEFIKNIGVQYYTKLILPRLSPLITQTANFLSQTYKQKLHRKQQQQIQLHKYPPTIDPTIDAINTWLLQISHHLLDHHNAEIKKNLIHVKQIPKQEMLEICHSQKLSNTFYSTHSYVTISEKIFKEFEFFYLKNVASNLQIDDHHEQNFEHLLYAFHRCLIDCMNLTLLDELNIGRNWVRIPWVSSFRYKKNQAQEHTKQCLERAINRVSGWGEYSLAQLGMNNDVNYGEWKQYQEEKMNLVIRQQVLEEPLENEFVLSNIVMQLCDQIYKEQMERAVQEFQNIFSC